MSLEILDWQHWLPLVFSSQGVVWVTVLVGLVVFLESSCILTPFLPGDSLLVTLGLMFAKHHLSIVPFALLVVMITVVGYQINMISASWIDAWLAKRFPQFVAKHQERIIDVKAVFLRHGMMFLLLARFSPIIRTYLPFCCGMANVNRTQFFRYNVIGAIIWVGLLVCLPYSLGHLEWVNQNAHGIIMMVVVMSMLPFVGVIGAMLYQRIRNLFQGVRL